MRTTSGECSTGSGEPGLAGEPEPVLGEPATQRRYGADERRRLLAELERSGETVQSFCTRVGVGPASIYGWRRAAREAAVARRKGKPAQPGARVRQHSPEQRRAAVEAFERSGLTQEAFARTYGISEPTLRAWLARYRAHGPQGLEGKKRGRPKGSKSALRRIGEGVRDEIARTQRRYPDFGLKKVRDFLRRFQGIAVSTGTVRRTLQERGIARAARPKRVRRKPPVVRRFERAAPRLLWQSDITSFVLPRTGTRAYLVAFVDDHSRFVVSHGLHLGATTKVVIAALREGIERFGKPKEVLTDQGPQYFAWRGKSKFQHELKRLGIAHVVARTHHPETLGKCERLWETIGREFWERVELLDLADARQRLEHFIAHYNFFRPHQGIDGLVPADRFFQAQAALRKTHLARLGTDELGAALEDAPRQRAYLFGQIGDEQVSVSGERGELIVQTSSGVLQRMALDGLGAPEVARKESNDGDADERDGRKQRCSDGTAQPAQQEAAELPPAAAFSARSQGAVDERHGCGAGEGAPGLHADLGPVAGPQADAPGGERALDPAAAGVAAQPAGAGGNDGRPPAPAASAAAPQPGGDDGRAGRRPERAAQAACTEGQEDRRARRADPALDRAAQAQERVAEVGQADLGGSENANASAEG